jgi:peptide chain release factor 3
MTVLPIDLRGTSCLDHAMTDLSTLDNAAAAAAPHARRRTFAIIAHPDAGKTTLTEKLLLFGGAIQLAGEVKAKKDRIQTRSDWMKIERERGISVVTSVMTFEYGGNVFNLLDTPGHEDFSEDTYRTLTAVDSAVMVIDAAKGIEPRTLKLFEVCRCATSRSSPSSTRWTASARPLRPARRDRDRSWRSTPRRSPGRSGQGKTFVGTYRPRSKTRAPRRGRRERCGTARSTAGRPRRRLLPDNAADTFIEELDLAREACKPFDLEAFREGHLTPVYFGSALRNFGVRDLIEALGRLGAAAARAGGRHAHDRGGRAEDDRLRLQDPGEHGPEPPRPHRLRAVCSGKLERGMKAKLVRTGKPMSLSAPQFFFARDRIIADEAYAGDVVGIPEPRHAAHRRHADRGRGHRLPRRAELRPGNPAPRPLKDAMKAKKLKEALQQMAEEGVVQLFQPMTARPPSSASSARCSSTC